MKVLVEQANLSFGFRTYRVYVGYPGEIAGYSDP